MTISGVHRGEQRKRYDQVRRDVLPNHGITLLELNFEDFRHRNNKRLLRDKENDIFIIREKLSEMKQYSTKEQKKGNKAY